MERPHSRAIMLNPAYHQTGRLRLRKDQIAGSSGQEVGSRDWAHPPTWKTSGLGHTIALGTLSSRTQLQQTGCRRGVGCSGQCICLLWFGTPQRGGGWSQCSPGSFLPSRRLFPTVGGGSRCSLCWQVKGGCPRQGGRRAHPRQRHWWQAFQPHLAALPQRPGTRQQQPRQRRADGFPPSGGQGMTAARQAWTQPGEGVCH